MRLAVIKLPLLGVCLNQHPRKAFVRLLRLPHRLGTMPEYIDIAANFTDKMYSGFYHGKARHPPDLENVIARAADAGVAKMVIPGGSLEDSRTAIGLCNLHDVQGDKLFVTVGTHPTRAQECESERHIYELRDLIVENPNRVVAVGEMGLDFDRLEFCSKEAQISAFKLQLSLTEEVQLPMYLHMRNAGKEFSEIMNEFAPLRLGGVCHSFTGTIQEANQIMSLGLMIGLNGCSLRSVENIEVVKQLPIDKIVLETDCPYCGLKPTSEGWKYIDHDRKTSEVSKPEKWDPTCVVKGRNEPCHIRQIAEAVHSLIGRDSMSFKEFCGRMVQNAIDVFPLMKK